MKKIIVLLFVLFFVASLASAAELKLVKVSDLKVGDIIISKAGAEIPVSTLVPIKSDTVTISDYIRQKVFGDKQEIKVDTKTTVGSGNSGQGVISGNVVVNLPEQNQTVIKLTLWQKIKGWFGLK